MKRVIATLMFALFVATAMPVAAENATSTTNTINRKTLDVACVQTALEKRDTAIITAYGAYSTAVQAALTTRKDALKAAWALPERKDRVAALKTAWTAYGKTTREARKTWNKQRLAAWNQWYKDRRTCRATDDVTSSGSDAAL